jgi:hypothetical protein
MLRSAGLALLIAGLAVWIGTGAKLGWTQTSRVTMHHDQITGIDYPVRTPAFVAGVEIPLAGIVAAAFFTALSFIPQLRSARQPTA